MATIVNVEALKPKKVEIAELLKRLELGLIPDEEIKRLIRSQLEKRLQWGYKRTYEQQQAQLIDFVHSLQQMSLALETDALMSHMNKMPISFTKIPYGSKIKESWCYFKDDSTTLDEAKVAMMELYCKRAMIEDGQKVLDLGCGHGALTIYVAQKYPNCHVTGITLSTAQKEFIEEQCRNHNLVNVEIIIADITKHEMDKIFDRVMVIDVFEHMRNYKLLLRKISKWMKQDGLLFIEHLCHKMFAYHLKSIDEDDWLEEFVFPAGTVTFPSAHFLLYFQDDVSIVNLWTFSGKHISRTSEELLKALDANANAAKAIMKAFAGSEEEAINLINKCRTLFLFAAELGKYNDGEEWMIAHLLFKKQCDQDTT